MQPKKKLSLKRAKVGSGSWEPVKLDTSHSMPPPHRTRLATPTTREPTTTTTHCRNTSVALSRGAYQGEKIHGVLYSVIYI